MSKRLTSTVLLFAIGIGFGIFSVSSLINAHTTEDVIISALYLGTAAVAIGALIMLPFREQR